MKNLTHLIVKPVKMFGRTDYHPVNSIAMLFKGNFNTIPAAKIAELKEAGYTIEEV